MKRTLDVALGHRSYPIHIGAGTLDDIGAIVSGISRRAVVISNASVAAHWMGAIRSSLAARWRRR